MSNYILPVTTEITFQADNHIFKNKQGIQYQSWSKVARTLEVPFDAQNVSLQMARGISRDKGISVEQAQKEILSEWEGKRFSSETLGNRNHDLMEKFAKTGDTSPLVLDTIQFVSKILKEASKYYSEFIVFSHKYQKAGIADLVVQRQNNWQTSVFDIYDYKTNEQKGIQFDSIGRKKDIKHYNRFLLSPFDYIEDCNFAIYSLQLCAYAYMLWEMYRIKIGRLAIIFIDKDGKPHVYPILYNPHVIEHIFTNYNELKELPVSSDRLI